MVEQDTVVHALCLGLLGNRAAPPTLHHDADILVQQVSDFSVLLRTNYLWINGHQLPSLSSIPRYNAREESAR
jgi:hypothetical protein